MFKDYKIPIAFLILVLIIILGVKAQAQNIILFDDDDYTGFWTPANLPIDTTSTSVYFYGEAPKTKVAKDSGGVSVKPYMRVWIDSTELMTNGTFDSDMSEWGIYPSGIYTAEWVTTGGGFTGAVHVVGDGTNNGIFKSSVPHNIPLPQISSYRLLADVNITSSTAEAFRVTFLYGTITHIYYTGTGVINIDTVLTGTRGSQFNLFFRQYGAGAMEFYIDNISLTPIVDSTYGYTYTIPRPSDTTTFYYSQSVWWRQKDKDTIWLAAETDTVTVYPYIEPQPDNINYMRTVDGDTMFTAEGDTMKTSYNFNFNKTNGEKNEEDIILPQRVYAVLNERRSTMDIETS
jgi:hypothetical protein